MQKQDQRPPGDRITVRGTFFVLLLLARALATCFTVFTRHTFGPEALGFNGVCAFILILVYATATNSSEMFRFFWVWLLALIVQRIRTGWAVLHGCKLHSHCSGYPWLGYLPGFVKSYQSAMCFEYAVCFFAGIFMCPVSETLGEFMIVGSWSLLIVYAIEHQVMVMDARRIRDAELEMQARVDLYRGNRDKF